MFKFQNNRICARPSLTFKYPVFSSVNKHERTSPETHFIYLDNKEF